MEIEPTMTDKGIIFAIIAILFLIYHLIPDRKGEISSVTKWMRAWRLKHHSCERNLVVKDRFTEKFEGKGCSVIHPVLIGRCKICGKRVDID